MGNFLIAEPSLSDAVQDRYFVTPGHENTAAGPISNLFTRQPKETWETLNVTGTIEARFDMGPPPNTPTYDFMALAFTNAPNDATIKWDGAMTASNFSVITWTSGTIPLVKPGQTTDQRRRHHFHLPGTQTARYVRFQIIHPTGNPDGIFRAGRLYITKAYRPTYNIKYGLGFGFEDDPVVIQTSAGESIARPVEPIPQLQFVMQCWGNIAQAEFYANVHELMRKVGSSRDVICIINPEHATLSGAMLYYGRLQSRQMIELPDFEYYEAAFQLRGMI